MSNKIEDIFSFKKTKNICPNQNTPIVIDTREKNSMIIANLYEKKAKIIIKKLEVGDYQINDLIIERKTKTDLINSLKTNRLKEQIKNLKKYKRLLIIEENKNNFKKINQNLLQNLIISITANHQIPIIFTNSEKETSGILIKIAKKEQSKNTKLNTEKIPKTLTEQKRFILESFPGIGAEYSKKIIKNFKTLKEFFNTSKEKIEILTNRKIANDINNLINSPNHQD